MKVGHLDFPVGGVYGWMFGVRATTTSVSMTT